MVCENYEAKNCITEMPGIFFNLHLILTLHSPQYLETSVLKITRRLERLGCHVLLDVPSPACVGLLVRSRFK